MRGVTSNLDHAASSSVLTTGHFSACGKGSSFCVRRLPLSAVRLCEEQSYRLLPKRQENGEHRVISLLMLPLKCDVIAFDSVIAVL